MKTFLSGGVALVTVILLSSCALLPFGHPGIYDDDHQRADARMEQIAAAVNDQDAGALKAMLSPRALEQATDIDGGLDYFLSFFLDGELSWERRSVNSEGRNAYGVETELLKGFYTVSSGGNDYLLFFADFPVNEFYDTSNVGIYALGITPLTEDRHSGTAVPFYLWTGSIRADESDEEGYPGVYLPPVK